jgi:hypothetical protein
VVLQRRHIPNSISRLSPYFAQHAIRFTSTIDIGHLAHYNKQFK